ncbi:hypothetical protein BACCAP_04761 [Pseudoflavonifractor capillosus ATCC 29799]|uniref:Uncharacterized protein n=1 Tax=Pseudoflavonifractor capillosus ATCC 29799 TaxID=411467 RepID=A6P2M9_9FIRM|nr:hypothetical protein BACCAP_04761 [Pseudoflavonifractor capillosus ATCC 29799]
MVHLSAENLLSRRQHYSGIFPSRPPRREKTETGAQYCAPAS